MFSRVIGVVLLSFFLVGLFGQGDKRYYSATRVSESIKVDAKDLENFWSSVTPTTDFIQFSPIADGPAKFKTEVKLAYDDEAIYVYAKLYDTAPDSINRELTLRDQFGNASWFSVSFDTYKDGSNGFGFAVTAAGVQADFKFSADGDDDNWDAVWESAVSIEQDGWRAEFKIPYSAIRFSDLEEQEWGLQFGRAIRRYREEVFWNRIDPELDGFMLHAGRVNNIKNIKSPIRLSLNPFVTGYVNTVKDPDAIPINDRGTAYSLGMDLKYGLTDAFTLDMTIVPDFGQTQSDNVQLNIGPFEQFFEERRPFFTEGTELFNKGDLFYSRRVGGTPYYFYDADDDLAADEEVISSSSTSQLLNAFKISGRTSRGTGIGFFNAIEAEEHALIENSQGVKREFLTNPLTNYNVLVVDQNLRYNSFVSFINTNVARRGEAHDANASAMVFNLKNKGQDWALNGAGKLTQKFFTDSTSRGHNLNIGLNKISGKINYGVGYNEESDKYDPNDLGLLFSPNERSYRADFSINEYEAKGRFNRLRVFTSLYHERLYTDNSFVALEYNARAFAVTKSFNAFSIFSGGQPLDKHDYFETRTGDFTRYVRRPAYSYIGGFVSTDYRKRLALDAEATAGFAYNGTEQYRNVQFAPRFRVNDQIFLVFRANWETNQKRNGFTDKESVDESILKLGDDEILFALYDRYIWNNVLDARYVISNTSSVTLRLRHYQDRISYFDFGTLNDDGSIALIDFDGLDEDLNPIFDNNVNNFNLDLQFTKRFAPGSDIIFVWKNQIFGSDAEYTRNYFENLGGLNEHYQTNSFSLRIVYFLDFLRFS